MRSHNPFWRTLVTLDGDRPKTVIENMSLVIGFCLG